jgi:hypothetical protein
MTEYVSINGGTIRKNAILGTDDPPIRVARTKSDQKPRYASEIEITGKCRLVYSPKKPILKCGARLVLEAADGSVKILR